MTWLVRWPLLVSWALLLCVIALLIGLIMITVNDLDALRMDPCEVCEEEFGYSCLYLQGGDADAGGNDQAELLSWPSYS